MKRANLIETCPTKSSYKTKKGITIHRTIETEPTKEAIDDLIDALNESRGVLLSSNYEVPGRYRRWMFGFINPPISISAIGRSFRIWALNERGQVLLPFIRAAVQQLSAVESISADETELSGSVRIATERFPEEMRSKQPSIFSLLRCLVQLFYCPDPYLGLYGAFGYDLAYQFENIEQKIPREPGQRDLVLFLPDEIYVVDNYRNSAFISRYDFQIHGKSTIGLSRDGLRDPYGPSAGAKRSCDHEPGEYVDCVRLAREAFQRGDLFEVVPGQTFFEPAKWPPSEIFRSLQERNPSPYGFLINLGEQEYLVGASPEMYVRVTGRQIETCPISGTIARGKDAIGDARQIRELLNSQKDESELTMCTDVDRNDKSRICVPGTVRVIGRRQIEIYSKLIHTVDHVEGRLADGYDALDGFLSHTWAVTVTGAPKLWAMRFLEEHERSPRNWYGGAVGVVGFNGDLNTGLTLRTIHIKNGIARIRAGATLLYDSDPKKEEEEIYLKAEAFLDVVRTERNKQTQQFTPKRKKTGIGKRIVLIDHQDSFVHTLANYFRQTGAEVTTFRPGFDINYLKKALPDLVVLSPGPGRPSDFALNDTIRMATQLNVPIFGVCLGLQGIVEYFGGKLGILPYPMHGKASEVILQESELFAGLPKKVKVGRYHSIYAIKEKVPPILKVTAMTEDGIVMAVEHESLPISAVQFHPESILTLEGDVGLKIIDNVIP